MLQHALKIAIRSLVRSRLFTFINAIGLSLGIAVFLALVGYAQHELSYDKFYEEGDRMYRIDYYEYQEGLPVLQTARTHDRTALVLQDYVPQIEAVTRVYHEKAYVFTEKVRLVDQDMIFADSSFFKVFGVKLISGDAETCLEPPKTVVISRSQAEVYFGNEDPIGKPLYFNERLPFTVTGVFEDIPENSSVDFDFILSWSTIWFYGWGPREGSFDFPGLFTFVKLRRYDADVASINNGLTDMINNLNTSLVNLRHTARHELRPYRDLHLQSGLSGELKPGTNPALLYSLVFLAIFILIASWINYINLSLARSLERAGEFGIRKAMGASGVVIGSQNLAEAAIMSFFTFLVGLGVFYLFTETFSNYFFGSVSVPMPGLQSGIRYAGIFVLGTLLAATYPAVFISRYNPVLILNNKLGSGRTRAGLLHQGLMVFQLFLAIAVVGITIMASMQMNFMRNFDSGFDAGHTISLRGPASTNSDSLRLTRYRAFRNEVLQNAAFQFGSASMNIPGEEVRYHDEGIRPIGSINEMKNSFWVMWIDEGYQETFGMKLVAGRNFASEEPGQVCMINESGAYALGYKNAAEALNTSFVTKDDRTVKIIGVWKDYHHESLRKPVEPMIFYYRHPHEYGYYSFRVNSREGNFLESLKAVWEKHYPQDTFNFYFMDRFFAEQYRSDRLFAKLLSLFSVISITVACLGLFGMATLSAVKRTKEIGVRKVLGASVWSILHLLSRTYVRLILISCLLAFPASYYLTDKWLHGFAYRISIRWWMIVIPGLVVLLATLLTISTQAIRAALVDPVKSLKEQ